MEAGMGEKQRQYPLRVAARVREAGGGITLRARSAPLAATRNLIRGSAQQSPAQGRGAENIVENIQHSITPICRQDNRGEPANILTSSRSADIARRAQVDGMRPTGTKGWLKTALKERVRETSISPSTTPTPGPKRSDRTPVETSIPVKPQSTITHVPRTPPASEESTRVTTTYSGFTSVNRRRSPLPLQSPTVERHIATAKLQNDSMKEKDPYEEVKHLSQEAVKRAQADEDARYEAERLSQEAPLRAYRTSANNFPLGSQVEATEASSHKHPVGSLHEVPSTTHMPSFEYRVAKKMSAPSFREPSSFSEQLEAAKADVKAKRPASATRSNSRFAGEMEAAKAKAKAQAIRRLSFTASGRIKSPVPRRPLENSNFTSKRQHTSPLTRMGSSHEELSSEEDAYASAVSKLLSISGDASKSDALPEAQVIVADAMVPKPPSRPSTILLETDKQSLKFPSNDEGDSYLNLSTQAAIAKAQLSFQNDVLSPFKSPHKHRSDLEISPTAYKTPKAALPLSLTSSKRVNAQGLMEDNNEEPISTQAMIDAMSPFAVTTVKKTSNLTRRDSFARSAVTSPTSPTANHFRPQSPSMSTSVSPSPSPVRHSPPPPSSLPISLRKGPSSLTSFSIVPNGTLTEVYQHDGQQQLVDEDGWNIEDALEEAGSFLGTWEVEAEARKVGSAANGGSSGTSGAKEFLSSGKVRE